MTGATLASQIRPLALDVVSVQSQVVYGSVGNNVAVPTLQALGWSVVAVPTVILGNTPHYPTMHGGALPIEWFEGYLQDLSARNALGAVKAVLAGYLGGTAQARALGNWIRILLPEHPGLRVVIDPVLGDHDHGIYVDAGLVQAYREHLLPLAHGLTPNAFELEQLTGRLVNDVASIADAARILLGRRTEWVAVTSAAPGKWPDDEMQVVVVTRTHTHVLTHPTRFDGLVVHLSRGLGRVPRGALLRFLRCLRDPSGRPFLG